MILDGYGLNDKHEGNAIYEAKTPVMDKLMAEYPFVKGNASGLAVGLPDGQMGNSEVGHIGRQDATDEEVIAAAKLAHCDKFAEKLPDGWNTIIGENGSELSGGERQRISIARAFLKDAPIILLDEATASLDVDNETMIQESLSRLIRNKTVMIIAHRMRTVADSDKIVVLKDGVVAEQGSPAELSRKNGIYQHMMETQMQAAGWKL